MVVVLRAMARFRKKPVAVEAHQFVGGAWAGPNIPAWYTQAFTENRIKHHTDGSWRAPVTHATISTREGVMTADLGDWIIKGVQGELYPCKPDIFAATYEPAE